MFKVKYKGTLLDGTVFDDTKGKSVELPLQVLSLIHIFLSRSARRATCSQSAGEVPQMKRGAVPGAAGAGWVWALSLIHI